MKRSTRLRLPARLRSRLANLPQEGASNTFANFGCPLIESLVLAEFETQEGMPRSHDATAKLTCRPLVAWLSAWASFGVRSVVWRNQIYGAGAALGNLADRLPLFIVGCWLFGLSEQDRRL